MDIPDNNKLGGTRELKPVSKSSSYVEEDAMNHKKLLPQMISLTLVLLLLVACTPQPTPVLSTPMPTPPPTATPTPVPPTPTPTTSSGEVETGNGEVPSPLGDGPASIDLDNPNWFDQPSNVETYRTSLEYTFSDADGSPAIGAVLVEGETVVSARN